MATTNKKKYSDIDLSKYNSGYSASKDVLNAQKLKTQAEEAVKNYGDFNYKNQTAYDDAMNAILNRKGFTYDVNGDALYQQYKDNYMRQGKLAMQDTMGQAAALTGGYGSSYATSVGNQAYQGYLAQLNDVIPELYNLALNSYNAEGDRLNTNFNLLATDRSAEYSQYADKYNQLVADRGYYSDNYNNAYTQDYSKWTDNRNYDQSQYWNEYNAGYQADRDTIADQQWQKQFDEGVRQYNETMAFNKAQAAKKGGSSGGSGGTTDTSGVPKGVLDKAAGITDNVSLANYLDGLEASGTITPAQADSLYSQYKQVEKAALNNREWTLEDNGGWNWGWGIDNNAKVKDQYGEVYRLDDLYDELKKTMSKDDAKKYITDLQKKVGATK